MISHGRSRGVVKVLEGGEKDYALKMTLKWERREKKFKSKKKPGVESSRQSGAGRTTSHEPYPPPLAHQFQQSL